MEVRKDLLQHLYGVSFYSVVSTLYGFVLVLLTCQLRAILTLKHPLCVSLSYIHTVYCAHINSSENS